jgi:hypothetical protein
MGGHCYLYGGRGESIHKSICEFNLDTLRWQEMTELNGEVPELGRYGHSSITYKKAFYFFGGETTYNPKSR